MRDRTTQGFLPFLAALVALLLTIPNAVPGPWTANHRKAPLTALDPKADITDWFAFVSYDDPTKVTIILDVDPLLEPSNGPNYFPFDPEILYEMKIDNNRDGKEDIIFQFRFQTEIRLRRADGEFRSILYSGVPRFLPGGTFAGLHRLRRRHHRPAERRAFPAAGGEHRPGFLDVRHRQAGATVRQPGL